VARVDRAAASRWAWLALLALGCGIETNGFVLRAAPPIDASIEREAGPVDATAEEACATCPRTIVLNDETTTPQPGGEGGTAYLDLCPAGQVVIGYKGSLNPGALSVNGVPVTIIGSIQTVCGHITIDDPSATFATITPGDTLDSRPVIPSTWSSVCDPNKVVVGFTGGSGAAFDKVAFQCTQLRITKGPSGDVATPDTSTIQTLPANGGDAGSTIYTEVCPDGKIAQGSYIRAMDWVVAFGLACATPVIAQGDAGAPCCNSAMRQTSTRPLDEAQPP
jgi:hypothetical protein